MKTLSGIIVLLFAASLCAADVDFSGTWILNEEKSELPEIGRGPGGGRGFTPPDMVITQKKNKITVTRTFTGRDGGERTMETVYDLSGKTTKETTRRGTSKHTAKMDGNVLKIETVRTMERGDEKFEMVRNATWTLADDGKGLVIETSSDSPMGEIKAKAYYNKQ